MYYDPEEEWVERVLSVKEKEENQARVQSQQTSWMKKPDGTWKKVPVNTNQSFPDVTRTTCPTGSKLNISVNSQSLFPETVRPPEPVPAPDMSRSIPVLVSGSSSLNPSFSPIVGNKDHLNRTEQNLHQKRADYLAKYKIKPKPNLESPTQDKSQSPAFPTLSPFQPPPPLPDVWQCRICKVKIQTETLFQMHLTTTHFRERIIRRINPPFKCLMCDYIPPDSMTSSEKTEDLLMHYGTTERISVKFYEDACRDLLNSEEDSQTESEPEKTTILCLICDMSLAGEKTLLKHLTLRHFPKVLCDDLPKKNPFRCPFIDCHQTRQNLHGLMLHYGVDHNVSMELYQKHFKVKKASQGASCSGISARVELPKTPRFAKLQAVVTPYHPESDEKSSQFRVPTPETEFTHEPTGSSRNRFRKSWGSEMFSDSQRIEELEEKLRQLEASHRDKLKEKQEEFARWVTSKESKLEEEHKKSQDLQAQLKERDEVVSDLQAQLELVHDNFSSVEETLAKKNKELMDLTLLKEQADQDIQEKETERINSYEELYNKEKEVEGLQEKLKETDEELELIKTNLTSEEDKNSKLNEEFETVSSNLVKTEKELQKKNKELEKKVKEIEKKNEELKSLTPETSGLKMKISKDKGSLRSTKIFISPEMQTLIDEKNSLSDILVAVQTSTETEITQLKKTVKELKKKNTENLKAKELEKEKKEMLKKIKVLESTLSNWESRQFTNVKLISGLEKERDTLQQKLKEMKDGNLSHEDQLYWKDVAIKNGEKEIKTLKAGEEEKIKEISEIKKELSETRSDLEMMRSKVRDLESKNPSSTSDIVSKERYQELENDLGNRINEIKHLKITLNQKVLEYSRVKSTALAQKAEMERLILENESLESDYSEVITNLETMKNISKDLEKKMSNKNQEIRELKDKLIHSFDKSKVNMIMKERQQAKNQKKEENRVEMLMMNQVLADMDTVIKLRENGASPEKDFSSTLIKDEPLYFDEPEMCTDDTIYEESSIVEEGSELQADTEQSSHSSSTNYVSPHLSFPSLSRILQSSESDIAIANTSSAILRDPLSDLDSEPPPQPMSKKRKNCANSKKSKKPKSLSNLTDVTDLYNDDNEEHVMCGICNSWDPPEDEREISTTEWVGCDCDRWFHKQCTQMKRISTKFSCKSVKMDCLVIPITSYMPEEEIHI